MAEKKALPNWWPEHPPIYDIHRSYEQNLKEGPFFPGSYPNRILPPSTEWVDFLGYKVAVPLGVPAGPLLNSSWTTLAFRLGFDVVTYKTIRSASHPAHPKPNMIYVDTKGPLSPERHSEVLQQAKLAPQDTASLAATNSFGIPSQSNEVLMEDIAYAQSQAGAGQVLIVSVVGTAREGEDYFEDFAIAAELACQAGAKIIEADLSCPNICPTQGSIYTIPEDVFDICTRIRKRIGDRPLIIKVGADLHNLESVMIAAAKAGVQAICGINTVSMEVVDHEGNAALGENRRKAGVCGGPIRPEALNFLQKAKLINKQEKLELTLMGTGGVTLPGHFDLFFEKGADVAMSAVGMMWDPYLAARYHNNKGYIL